MMRDQVIGWLSGNAVGQDLLERWKHWRTQVYLLSYPKCGRTWLRLMIGKALVEEYRLEVKNPMEIGSMHHLHPAIPRVRLSHERKHMGSSNVGSKERYAGKTVILLVRDPRDVVVSMFFQASRRVLHSKEIETQFTGDLSHFIRERNLSLGDIIAYYNRWAECLHIPRRFALVRYEDLHASPHEQLNRVFEFMNVHISQPSIDRAIEFSKFDNMRKLEGSNAYGSNRLRPADASDPESFKTRRGKIGGYREYMTPTDLEYVDERIRTQLSSFYDFYRT